MTRTLNDGVTAGQTGRFTTGYPDAINAPDSGTIAGQKPFIWMTGGDIAANADPAVIGMDRILLALTNAGYTICQAHVPMGQPANSSGDEHANIAAIGNDSSGSPPAVGGAVGTHNPGAIGRINDAVSYARAHLGATSAPPILLGVSNGWVCSIIYARQFPITGIVGILPVVDSASIYATNAFGFQAVINYEWGVSDYAAMPLYGKIFPDVANYPDLYGKVLAFYSGNDELYVGAEMSFLTQIHAEMHNVGAYGHLGTLSDATFPCAHVDTTRLVAYVNSIA